MLDSTRTRHLAITSIAVILLLGSGATGVVSAQTTDGEQVFKQNCASCHNGAPDSRSRPAPRKP
jgi:mono/diheme cytochrome c family protein